MTRKISESLFTSVLYLFSSAMLILSLLMSIKLNSLSDSAEKAEKQIAALKQENALLTAELERLTSLDALADYAVKAGMIKCPADSIEYLTLAEIGQ